MKRVYKLLITVALVTFWGAGAIAQNIKIIVAPFHIGGYMPRTVGVQFENKLNINNSFGMGIESYYLEPNISGDGEYNGVKVNFAYRRYFSHKSVYKGFYVSPSLNYLRTDVPERDEPSVNLKSGTRTGFGIGLRIGKQYVVGRKILLGYSFGRTYYRSTTKKEFTDSSKRESKNKHAEFNLDFSIGWLIRR